MSEMVCGYADRRDQTIVAYLYGEITPAEREAFQAHLTSCAACREEVAGFRAVREDLAAWRPPSFESAGRSPRSALEPGESTAGSLHAPIWPRVPVWTQAIAATLVLGIAAGAANLNIRHDANGFTIRTGWMASAPAPAADTAGAPWRADLDKLGSQLRAERDRDAQPVRALPASQSAPARPASADAEILRQVKALVAESEKKQENELALRVAQVVRDDQAARTADLVKIERMLGLMQNNATVEVARNREMINSLAVRVSQTQLR